MIRIRQQVFIPGQKLAAVKIVSVDEFTRTIRKLVPTVAERIHLINLLTMACKAEDIKIVKSGATWIFWAEKL